MIINNAPFTVNIQWLSEYRTVWVCGIQMVNSHDLADYLNTGHFGPQAGFFSLVFRSPFECWTIWQSDTKLPFKYQTSPVFRWLLYTGGNHCIQWGSGIVWILNHKKEVRLQMVWILNGTWKPEVQPFEIWTKGSHYVKSIFKSGFWMVGTIVIAVAKARPFEKWTIWNPEIFLQISNVFLA